MTEDTIFGLWYLAVESLGKGRIVGERENMKPLYAAGLSPAQAVMAYCSA